MIAIVDTILVCIAIGIFALGVSLGWKAHGVVQKMKAP